jgi:Porin subfamily
MNNLEVQMKMVKSLLLGSAAGIVGVAGAQAADLPVKAKPVEYVKICSLYGDGFYYIPGTDTCVRFAGRAQADYGWNVTGARTPNYTGAGGANDRTVSNYSTRFRADLDIDARAQTAYGTIRTFERLRIDLDNGTTSPAVPRAFIQWAGWTFGRVKSISDVPGQFGGDGFRSLHQPQNHSDSGGNGNNEISYTWELGNGMTLNVGAGERRTKAISNLSVNVWGVGANPTGSNAGMMHPDPFVAFHVNQAWGRFGVSATLTSVRANYFTAAPGAPGYAPTASCVAQPGTTFCAYPQDELGFAVDAGLVFNVPWIAPGDQIGGYAQYGQGGGAKATGNNLTSPGLYGGGNQIALGALTDAVYVNGAGLELTTAWTAGGAFVHWWTRNFSSTVYGNYTEVSYNNTVIANRWWCGGGGGTTQNVNMNAVLVCDPGFKFATVGSHTDWYPVPGLRLAVDVLYTMIDSNLGGQFVSLNTRQGARPTGIYLVRNQGILTTVFRAVKDWPAGGEGGG